MADKMFLFSISENYAESCWFQCDQELSPDCSIFSHGIPILSDPGVPRFFNNKISVRRTVSFDYFHSNTVSFVGDKLRDVMARFPRDIQLFPAEAVVGGVSLKGCSVFNAITVLPCIDMERSDHEPMLDFMPEGPKRFFFIKSLFAEALQGHDFVLAQESLGKIFVSGAFKAACEHAGVKGVDFVDCS